MALAAPNPPLATPADATPPNAMPLVGVSACRVARGRATAHSVGDKYVDAVVEAAGALPVIIPAIGPALAVETLLMHLDGVLLTGSPSNLDPDLYGGGKRPTGDPADADRDATTLPLIRACIANQVPLFAVCRGIQELNVALGGSLFGRLHEVAERHDHRSDKTLGHAERYLPRHAVHLCPDGLLARLFGGATRIEVNSLHGQGIDRLAPGLNVEATAEDGTIEAVSGSAVLGEAVSGAAAESFVLGVQWHPEWQAASIEQHRRLFTAFGDACRRRLSSKGSHERPRALA